MRVIGITGWSGAGKTTLVTKLIPALAGRGLTVATMKHAHHGFDVDQPGKDSRLHRDAGGREVLVASGRRVALVRELAPDEPEPSLGALLARLSPADVVLVEGWKGWAHPKIAVHRAANGAPPLHGTLASVRAVASDVPLPDAIVPVIDLDDVEAIADAVLRHGEERDTLLPALQAPVMTLARPKRRDDEI
ncbi:molybdopterin-guanine dinucleotide biosynthesis protein MobB [Salinarimonas ramus]|uniref:Molybdopterin-guanine dinucleotide biosynthesis protein MobB n=1 Tax=Salinarimonas ramus TaxID=690164 RepID=A0A917QHE2_9HYPH|nr:molybdopterin-guanine dinucleotide biosynthesis protein MobB [Salinarimonas ramus]